MKLKETNHSFLLLAVSADSFSHDVFEYENGTKRISMQELIKVVKMIHGKDLDPTKDGEVYVTSLLDDTKFLVRYFAKTHTYYVLLP